MALNVSKVVHLRSDVSGACPLLCGATFTGHDSFEAILNHMLTEHGYTLLHVGSETDRDYEGHIWNVTAAVMGIN